jgi:hypothetical protein
MKKKKKMSKAAVDIVRSSVILGVGGSVVGRVAPSATYGRGITTMARYTPVIASTTGAGIAMQSLGRIKMAKKRRRKRKK